MTPPLSREATMQLHTHNVECLEVLDDTLWGSVVVSASWDGTVSAFRRRDGGMVMKGEGANPLALGYALEWEICPNSPPSYAPRDPLESVCGLQKRELRPFSSHCHPRRGCVEAWLYFSL